MNRAIPFIRYQNGKFQLDPAAEDFLNALPAQDKLSIISIVGKYRTGKSFFVNRVLLNQQSGFSVGPTINPCTKGLWIWNQVIDSQNAEYPNSKCIIIDTEGFGGMDENVNHDTRIFLFSLLLSSYFIYNSVGNIDENALNTISLIVNLAKEIQAANDSTFPQFLWIVRDFALQMVNKQGFHIQPKEFLENALELQNGLSDQVEQKNRIRRMIKHFFKDRDCMTMVRPVEQEDDLQKLDSLNDSKLRTEFVNQMNAVRGKIFKKIKPKLVQNQFINGQQLLSLAKAYIDTMNSGKVPNVDTAWGYVCKAEGEKALKECVNYVEQQIGQLKNEVIQWDKMQIIRSQMMDSVKKLFKQKALGQEEDLKGFLERLNDNLDEQFKQLKQQNKKNMRSHQEKFLEPQLENIINKLKNEEYNNFYELQNEMFKIRDKFEKEQGRSLKNAQFFDEMSLQVYQQAAERLTRKMNQNSQNENKQLQIKIQRLEQELDKQQKQNEQEKLKLIEQIQYYEKDRLNLEQQKNNIIKEINQLQKEKEDLQQLSQVNQQKVVNSLEKLKNESQQNQNQYEKQIALLQQENNFLQKELSMYSNKITQMENDNKKLRQETIQTKAINENLQQKCNSLDHGRAQEIQKLQMEFERKIMELTNDIDSKKQNVRLQSEWMVEKSYLENQVNFLKSQLDENKRLHDALLIALQQNGNNNDYQEGTLELLETNRNLSAALDKMEIRCKQLEEKVEKQKKFKKMVRNSINMQCLHCQKQFNSSGFGQHIQQCMEQVHPSRNSQAIIQPQSQPIDLSQLQISINQTMVRETPDNKPYTEYMIRVSYNNRKWTVSRRYKNFCELHQQVITQFPNIKMPESSSAIINTADIGSMFTGKRPTVIEERRKALQQFIRDLAKMDSVRNSLFYKKFLELDEQCDQVSRSVSQMGSPKNEGLQSSRDQSKEQYPKPQIFIGASTSRSMMKESIRQQQVEKKENLGSTSTVSRIDRKLLPQSPQSFLKAFQKQQENSKIYKYSHQQSLLELSEMD